MSLGIEGVQRRWNFHVKHELSYTVSTRYNLGRLEIVARIGENCDYIYIYYIYCDARLNRSTKLRVNKIDQVSFQHDHARNNNRKYDESRPTILLEFNQLL